MPYNNKQKTANIIAGNEQKRKHTLIEWHSSNVNESRTHGTYNTTVKRNYLLGKAVQYRVKKKKLWKIFLIYENAKTVPHTPPGYLLFGLLNLNPSTREQEQTLPQ